jgi:hypothetical protein
MSDDEFIEDIKDKACKTPSIQRDTVMKMIKAYIVSSGRRKQKIGEKLSKIVNRAYNRHALNSQNPVLSFPDRKTSEGDGPMLGYVCAGDQVLYPFYLRKEEMREGIILVARSGHGKTRFVYGFVDSLVRRGLNWVVWDLKDDYMELAYLYDDVIVLNWNDIRYNVLVNAPKGMELGLWWGKVWEVFCHSFGILTASSSYIMEKLEELYGDRKGSVTFADLYHFLKSANEESRKKDEYLSVAENRVYAVNRALGEVLNCKYGFEISEIFKRRVVIRLRGMDNSMQGFFIQILLMHEFYSRMYERVRM